MIKSKVRSKNGIVCLFQHWTKNPMKQTLELILNFGNDFYSEIPSPVKRLQIFSNMHINF